LDRELTFWLIGEQFRHGIAISQLNQSLFERQIACNGGQDVPHFVTVLIET
jgi:hypothetical protein